MQVSFKQNFIIEGKFYGKGVQEVPDALKSHWYLKAIVDEGRAELVAPNAGDKKAAPPKKPIPANKPPANQGKSAETGKDDKTKG